GIDLAGRAAVSGISDLAGGAGAGGKNSGGGPSLEGTVTLGIDAAALARWFPPDARPSGRVDFKLGGAWRAAAPRLEGTFVSETAHLYGVEARSVRGALRYDDALHLDDVAATLFDGTVRGGMTVRARPAGGWDGNASVSATRLDAASLLRAAGWTGPAIEGGIGYSGRHTFDQEGTASLRGGGD